MRVGGKRLLAADPAVRHDDHMVERGEIAVVADDDHGAAIIVREVCQDPLDLGAERQGTS
jgi:hypothetical protein